MYLHPHLIPSGASHQSDLIPSGKSNQSDFIPSDASHQSDLIIPYGASHQSGLVPAGVSQKTDLIPSGRHLSQTLFHLARQSLLMLPKPTMSNSDSMWQVT